MDESLGWLLALEALLVGGAVGLGLFARRGLARRARLAATSTVRVGAAEPGPVELRGRAFATAPEDSPVSRRTGVAWRWIVRAPSDRGFPLEVGRLERAGEFVLEDETGRALVRPKVAQLDLPERRFKASSHEDDGTVMRVAALVGSVPLTPFGRRWLDGGELLHGGAVWVHGTARPAEPGEAPEDVRLVLDGDELVVSTRGEKAFVNDVESGVLVAGFSAVLLLLIAALLGSAALFPSLWQS